MVRCARVDFGLALVWIDARRGHIVDVHWGRPDHEGYHDFRLRLVARAPDGAVAWTARLRQHFEGCPTG